MKPIQLHLIVESTLLIQHSPSVRFFVPLHQMSGRSLRLRRSSARLRYDLSPAERYSDTLVWEMQHTLLGLIGFDSVL